MSGVEIIAEGLAFSRRSNSDAGTAVCWLWKLPQVKLPKFAQMGRKKFWLNPAVVPMGWPLDPMVLCISVIMAGLNITTVTVCVFLAVLQKIILADASSGLILRRANLMFFIRNVAETRLTVPMTLSSINMVGFGLPIWVKLAAVSKDVGALFYAKPDGSMIREAVFPIESPNGVGLSPDESIVYVADTVPGRLWSFDIVSPSVVAKSDGPLPGTFVGAPQGLNFFDSLAVDSEGNVCVATIFNGGITSFSPDGSKITHTAFDDFITTNICFGGEDLKTAYVTLSSTGRLAKNAMACGRLAVEFPR